MNFRWSYDATSELIEVICIIWKALWRLISPLLYPETLAWSGGAFSWLPDTLNFGSLPFPTPIPKTLLEAWGHSLDLFIFLLPALSPGSSWVVKIPCRKEKLSTPVFWPREFHALYSPWGRKELDMTEWFSLSLSSPGSGRFSGVGNGNPLQYSCLRNRMDRGAWCATVHGVTRVGHYSVHVHTHAQHAVGVHRFVLNKRTQYLHVCILSSPTFYYGSPTSFYYIIYIFLAWLLIHFLIYHRVKTKI